MNLKLKSVSYLLWLLTIIWMILIFNLSAQNGTQTAQTSSNIAQKTAEIIYRQPTEIQVNQIHLIIRKLAHVGLFFILGVLLFSASVTFFGMEKKRKYMSIAIALAVTTCYGFLDEWQKQFIDGRHFHLDEAAINMLSGVGGVGAAIAVVVIRKKLIAFKLF